MIAARPLAPGRSLLLSVLILGGCAQAAIDADAGLYDMLEGDSDAGVDAALEDSGQALPDPDASLALDSATFEAAVPEAGVDAGVAGGQDGGADAAAADAGSECVAGTYKGQFQGVISVKFIGIELLNLDITGDVTIQVATNSTGDKLVLNDGKIVGKDQDGNPLQATVSGTLNCTTGELEGGKLENGKYTRPIGSVSFEGTATAEYTPNPPAAKGTWKTSGGVEMGMGTWDAALVK